MDAKAETQVSARAEHGSLIVNFNQHKCQLLNARDIKEQSHLLSRVSELGDQHYIQTTISKHIGTINAKNLRAAHQELESGRSIEKSRLKISAVILHLYFVTGCAKAISKNYASYRPLIELLYQASQQVLFPLLVKCICDNLNSAFHAIV